MTDDCFAFINKGQGLVVNMMPVADAALTLLVYTKLNYITSGQSPEELLKKAIIVTLMVEDLDGIRFTNEERLTPQCPSHSPAES